MTMDAGTLPAADGDSDRNELIRRERAIARKYIGKFPLAMAIWSLGNLVCWRALAARFHRHTAAMGGVPDRDRERHSLLSAFARSSAFELR
jgi:hypothetical protein